MSFLPSFLSCFLFYAWEFRVIAEKENASRGLNLLKEAVHGPWVGAASNTWPSFWSVVISSPLSFVAFSRQGLVGHPEIIFWNTIECNWLNCNFSSSIALAPCHWPPRRRCWVPSLSLPELFIGSSKSRIRIWRVFTKASYGMLKDRFMTGGFHWLYDFEKYVSDMLGVETVIGEDWIQLINHMYN